MKKAPKKKSASGWRAVLGFPPGARPTDEAIRARHRELIRLHHPDRAPVYGGLRAAEINAARDEALCEGAFAPNAHRATERAAKKRTAA